MKKVLFYISLILVFSALPSYSADEGAKLPNIFIYSIPDDVKQKPDVPDDIDAPEDAYIQDIPVSENRENQSENEVNLNLTDFEDDDSATISATTLKGYAEYIEDVDSIYLKDNNNQPVLNLKVPQKITSKASLNLQDKITDIKAEKLISKYSEEEYKISADSAKTVAKFGNVSFGTMAGYDVDTSMLEYETGLFTKYQRKKFALSSMYKKSLNTTYGQYIDTFQLAPEYRINRTIAFKEIFSADMTRNRKSGEFVMQVTPFACKGNDRLNLELGAKHTMDETNTIYRTQFRFSTEFKF